MDVFDFLREEPDAEDLVGMQTEHQKRYAVLLNAQFPKKAPENILQVRHALSLLELLGTVDEQAPQETISKRRMSVFRPPAQNLSPMELFRHLAEKSGVQVGAEQRLDLSAKDAAVIAEHANKFGPKLVTLMLNELRLGVIPPEVYKCSSLETLEVAENQLRLFPTALGQLTALRHLSLFDNQIQSVPSEVKNLQRLQTLQLHINQLVALPDELFELPNLRTLDLFSNLLARVSSKLGQLSNLTALNLRSNQLRSLPSSLSSLNQLTMLNLSNNCLSFCDLSKTSFPKLRKLSLRDNRLKTFSLGSCAKLEQLDLAQNVLVTVEKIDAPLLQTLELSRNSLVDVSNVVGLSALTALNLDRNQLKSLPASFARLSHVKTLNLAYNAFKALPDEILKLSSLTMLDLTGNEIKEVVLTTSTTPSTLQTLLLAENRLVSFPDFSSPSLKHVSVDLNDELTSSKTPLSVWQHITVARGIVLCGTSLTTMGACPDAANVDRVYLGQSYQSSFSGDTLQNFSRLQELFLGGLGLKSLPAPLLSIVTLKKLWLSNNNLTALERISALSKLELLDVAHNRLNKLPSELFVLPLQDVDLSDNQISSLSDKYFRQWQNTLRALDVSYNTNLSTVPLTVRFAELEYINIAGTAVSTWAPNGTPVVLTPNLRLIRAGYSLQSVSEEWRTLIVGIIGCVPKERRIENRFTVHSAAMRGRRHHMEDSFVVQHQLRATTMPSHVFAVFDGFGSPDVAELAARNFVPALEAHSGVDLDDAPAVKAMLFQSMLSIRLAASHEVKNLNAGTTAGICVANENVLHFAHMGDVGIVLVDNWQVSFASVPHNGQLTTERLRIQRLGGWVAESGRICNGITISRAATSKKYAPYVTLDFSVHSRGLLDSHNCVIVASDGLWDSVSPELACRLLKRHVQCTGSFRGAATMLCGVAFQKGAHDNITALVVELNQQS